jgi:hypothetical protein
VLSFLLQGRSLVDWVTTSEEFKLNVYPWLNISVRVTRAELERRLQAALLEGEKLNRAMKS